LSAKGGSVDRAALTARGLSNREIDELLAKLQPSVAPDFELDLAQAKSGEEFARRFEAAVPALDRKTEGTGAPAGGD
jgi:hypothetical protein